MQPSMVLAVGAAGSSAGMVTRALAGRGITVRGLVRSPSRVRAAIANGAKETAVADLVDRTALDAALDGVDAVFHIVPAFAEHEERAGTELVEAADAAGVRRIVFSSVYHPALPLTNHRSKLAAEAAIYDSSMEFTVLQPAMFMAQLDALPQQAKLGHITGPYSAASRMSYVDYRDVAAVAVDALTTDALIGGTFELAAPGVHSRHDLARILSQALGIDVAADGAVPTSVGPGVPTAMADGLLRMFRHYDQSGFRGGNSLILETLLGREPMTVERYLRELVTSPH